MHNIKWQNLPCLWCRRAFNSVRCRYVWLVLHCFCTGGLISTWRAETEWVCGLCAETWCSHRALESTYLPYQYYLTFSLKCHGKKNQTAGKWPDRRSLLPPPVLPPLSFPSSHASEHCICNSYSSRAMTQITPEPLDLKQSVFTQLLVQLSYPRCHSIAVSFIQICNLPSGTRISR